MNVAAGPELAAAVTNAGGMGVLGGIGYTPKILRQQVCGRSPLRRSILLRDLDTLTRTTYSLSSSQIKEIKSGLKDPNGPFGVDLLLPQVGGNARKTNVSSVKCRSPYAILTR